MLHMKQPSAGVPCSLMLVVVGVAAALTARLIAQEVLPAGPAKMELGSLPEAFRVAPDLYCGPQPRTAKDFASLQRVGVKTVICVDGVVPRQDLAEAAGMRYVHLPVGFSDAQKHAPALLAAMNRLPGPFYIHCRYGRPRTPILVAMIAQSRLGWDADQVAAWLKLSGASEGYQGLQKSLADFKPPTDAEIRAVEHEFLPKASTTPLVHAMGALLDSWDPLRIAQTGGFQGLDEQALQKLAMHSDSVGKYLGDLGKDPSLREWGNDFVKEMNAASAACHDLAKTLRQQAKIPSPDGEQLSTQFKAVGARCGACHTTYRN